VRGRRLHTRYRRQFWTIHSFWALLTGAAVLVLAHNRYGFVPWVVAFLLLTWGTTLFFSRWSSTSASNTIAFARGFVSYLTRVMYQETLFFLIPFYSYSTTFPAANSLFVVVLAGLAVFSCFDIPFDRLLRANRVFAMTFFGLVTFSALNLLLPILLEIRVHQATALAAATAFVAAVPLAYRWSDLRRGKALVRVGAGVLVALALATVARPLVPPVPLRLVRLKFSPSINPDTMEVERDLPQQVWQSDLAAGRLFVVATVFAPERLPTSLTIRFRRDGVTLRRSRVVEVEAHPRGFRIWDALRFPGDGPPPAGRYWAEVWTGERHLVGRGALVILPDPPAAAGQPLIPPADG